MPEYAFFMSKTHRIIHHTADTSKSHQFEKTKAYHDAGAGGKWPAGHGIQYHRLVEKDGIIVHCNDYERICWHAGSTEWNVKAAGWCLAGRFTEEDPTKEQLDSLFLMWKNEGFPPLKLHKEVRDTSCPGSFDFIGVLNEMYWQDLKQRMNDAIRSIPRVSGERLKSVVRFIERVKQLLSSSPR